MSEEQKKQLFIQHCLTKKDKIFLSEPMNTKHEAMYAAFKTGKNLGREFIGIELDETYFNIAKQRIIEA